MREPSTRTQCLLLVLLITLCSGLLYSQGGANGTILGTVTDSSGAVLANVGVDVTSVATGVTNHTQTTSAGDFTVPYLPPGIYQVTVQAPGFRKSVTENIGLVVGQQARVNVAMKPGAVSESVQVQASAVALDTDSSAVSQTVTQRQVDELPLNGRNFLNLLFISAGVVQTVGEQGLERQGQGNAISINGSRPESINYTLDGLVNTDTALNTPAVILSQDAIQEFKVQSENYSAEYGYSASQVNIVSKSGTNQIHGTAFEFARNDAFDALTPTPFQTAPKRPVLRQHQFGFVLGGPLYVPKLYDGRNKTFWLANYEGWRIRNGFVTNGIVPTAAELGGDFSASGLPAFDLTPGSPCQLALTSSPTKPCMPGDPTTGAAYPGNIIPTTAFSRLANVAVPAAVVPAPTPACVANPDVCGGGTNNYQLTGTLPNTTNQQTYKLDQDMGREGRVFFRYTKSTYASEGSAGLTPTFGLLTFGESATSWTISHTVTLGAHNINNFRVGYLDSTATTGSPAASSSQISSLGLTGVFTNLPSEGRGFPMISFDNPINRGNFGGASSYSTTDIPTWEFADSMTMIRGKHTISLGFDYRRFPMKRNVASLFLGSYNYSNSLILTNSANASCTTPSGSCGTGNSIADFLLGYYNGAINYQPGPFSDPKIAGNLNQYEFRYFAPYVQDDWKVNSRLTLNLGLRWDYRSVPYEKSNKMFWIDSENMPGGSRFTGGGMCFADPTLIAKGIAPPGNGYYTYCGRRNPADGSKKPFAPRFGFAYRPFGGDKTVVRGGYGIFFDSSETREIDNSGDQYPFVETTELHPNAESPTIAPKLTDQLFPSLSNFGPVQVPSTSFNGVMISERPRNPYFQQFTLSVQHLLPRGTILEMSYVGNRGLHLLDRFLPNFKDELTGTQLTTCQAAFAGLPATIDEFNANNCAWYQGRRLPNFALPGPLDSEWSGYSNYNAGNVKLEHRSADLALLAVYTYAKSLDEKSAPAGIGASGFSFLGHMNDRKPWLDYGPSDFNVKHRFVGSVVYGLPIGRGKRFLGNLNRAGDALIGGWQLSSITTFQTGFPFTVTASDQGAYLSIGYRANQIGDPNVSHKSINQWFNTTAFAQPAYATFANQSRNSLTQPGINNWDVGLAKTFKFTEKVGFQFRVETFNTFNHTQYGVDPIAQAAGGNQSSVDASFGSPTFGRVTSARRGRIVQFGGKIIF